MKFIILNLYYLYLCFFHYHKYNNICVRLLFKNGQYFLILYLNSILFTSLTIHIKLIIDIRMLYELKIKSIIVI